MKTRAIDMIIDTVITVVFAAMVIFNWGYLSTVEPNYGTGYPCVMALLSMSVGAVGFIDGVRIMISYFFED